MRKIDGDITSSECIERVLSSVSVCRLAMCVENTPYMVPLNFAHEGTTVWVHCAKAGKKIDILKQNPVVFFEATREGALMPSAVAGNICKSDFSYQCVMAEGTVTFIENETGKRDVLNKICVKYYGHAGEMPAASVRGTCVMRIELRNATVKQSGEWE